MFRILLPVWLLGQIFVSAGTLEFSAAEKTYVNSAARFASLPASLQQRVANNTLAWMTDASGHVLGCWAEFGGPSGVIAEPRPSAAMLGRTRERCAAALRALSADDGPAPRTADMAPAVSEFLQASRTVVQSAIRALASGIDEKARARAVTQFDAYYRTLETGKLPLWMLRAAADADEDQGPARRA